MLKIEKPKSKRIKINLFREILRILVLVRTSLERTCSLPCKVLNYNRDRGLCMHVWPLKTIFISSGVMMGSIESMIFINITLRQTIGNL